MALRRPLIQRVTGLFILIFNMALLPPLGVSLFYADGEALLFLESMVIAGALGLLLWWPVRHAGGDLGHRDGFLIVVLFWVVLSALSALPLVLGAQMRFIDAMFEAVSGFTTTGATVLIGLDNMSPSILYYRQQLNWLGGMGVIVLAVALLPLLGSGGMQLYKAETPGPMKDDKLTPRITQTARILWLVYLGLTVICTLAFWLAGMTLFDAIGHAMATVATGGFSSHDASFGYFDSVSIEIIAEIFMVLGAINFAVHFLAWRDRSLTVYWVNREVRVFLFLIIGSVLIVTVILAQATYSGDWLQALRHSAFQAVSFITSTGFFSQDYTLWPSAAVLFLFYIACIGGCGGSTCGGLKVMRVILLVKQSVREMKWLLHPHAAMVLRIDRQVISARARFAVWGFISLYAVSGALLMLLLTADGLDLVTAFSITITTLNNTGPALGVVGANFTGLSDYAKVVSILGMLLGRLELFTLIIVFTPAFWRR